MQNKSYCLGLDISSTVVGYCVSTSKEKVTNAGYIDIRKHTTIKDKAHKVAKELDKLNLEPSEIIVEDTLSGFGGGRTSQQTIVKLSKCNAVISYVIEALYTKDVEHVNVSSLRKAVFGRSREQGKDSKTFVREQLEKVIDLSDFIVYNSRKNYDKRNYDMLDATVASLYHWYTIDN
jgi:Holliday junction resolvasome RuvABC endonuclease subunit